MTTENAAEPTQNGSQAAENADAGPDEQRIPYARFEEVNTRAKRAEKELEDLRQRIVDFEERDKSDADRAKARAQRAEQQLEHLQGTVTAMQKGAWVRSAA